jgi:hypothetical protein
MKFSEIKVGDLLYFSQGAESTYIYVKEESNFIKAEYFGFYRGICERTEVELKKSDFQNDRMIFEKSKKINLRKLFRNIFLIEWEFKER